MKNKLLIFSRTPEKAKKDMLDLNLPNLDIYAPEDEIGILEHIGDTDIIFGNPPIAYKYINKAKTLKWYQSDYAGVDAMIGDDLKSDYILTNVKDTYGPIMSEYVFGYILLQEKEILQNLEHQKNKYWAQKGYMPISGKAIGIMGTGSIGKEIGTTAQHFGMKVLGYSQSGKQVDNFDETYTKDNITDFLSQVDYLVSVLPNTNDTKNLINKEVFSHMKKTSTFISVGRGANVDEDDLVKALEDGNIASAVIDVFQVEPLPKDSKLWSLDNIIITPHVSGYTLNNTRSLDIFKDNYLRFTSRKELKYKIDFNKGY